MLLIKYRFYNITLKQIGKNLTNIKKFINKAIIFHNKIEIHLLK